MKTFTLWKLCDQRILFNFLLASGWMVSMLSTLSCRKEYAPEPSTLDGNYFVVSDDPGDPVEHAIYEFYKSTGIASFYKDTIYRKQISKENETPTRYSYIKLSLTYSPFGNQYVSHRPLSSKDNIPTLLQLMRTDVVPALPPNQKIPSILLVDSFATSYPTLAFVNSQIAYGWTSLYGFNTVAVAVKDVNVMTSAERKMYAASILAGLAVKWINEYHRDKLQKDFFSITRASTKNLVAGVDIYINLPFMYFLPPNKVPTPTSIGLLYHPTFQLSGIPMETMPREADDSRAFLTAAFYYTSQEFIDLHTNEALLLKKFSVIKTLAKEVGFKLPD